MSPFTTTIEPKHLLLVQNWEGLAREVRFQPTLLARRCGVSLRQLERSFLLRFGQPPGVWMREFKCRLARELIARGSPNKAVVNELSFGNESHLCHEFRRFFGASPQTFAPLQRDTPASLGLNRGLRVPPIAIPTLPTTPPHLLPQDHPRYPVEVRRNSTRMSRLDNTTPLHKPRSKLQCNQDSP